MDHSSIVVHLGWLRIHMFVKYISRSVVIMLFWIPLNLSDIALCT